MPPSRDQFEKQYGDTILADYDDEPAGDNGALDQASKAKNDEEAPKATADVMMSRNLKGGAGKNFNFAFSSDGDDNVSPQRNDAQSSGSESDGEPINLLAHKGIPQPAPKKGFVKPSILTLDTEYDVDKLSEGREQPKTKNGYPGKGLSLSVDEEEPATAELILMPGRKRSNSNEITAAQPEVQDAIGTSNDQN